MNVRRYDVEQFQKIEALTGQKMEKYDAEEEAALLLLERVSEAQKMATMQVGQQSMCTAPCSLSISQCIVCRLEFTKDCEWPTGKPELVADEGGRQGKEWEAERQG